MDDISLDLLPADLDLDLDDAHDMVSDGADTAGNTDESGTDTGGPEPLHAKPQRDPVLAQAAEVRYRLSGCRRACGCTHPPASAAVAAQIFGPWAGTQAPRAGAGERIVELLDMCCDANDRL